jgi:hypothetical protein
MYGELHAVDYVIDRNNIVIYNITSLSEKYRRIPLIPPNSLGANSEYEFDIKYMNWILGNDNNFCSLMTIINDLVNRDVFLLISNDNWSKILIESLLKLIQQRYGINAVYIDTEDDLLYAEESGFSDYGVLNLDEDRTRYMNLYEQYAISTGEYTLDDY